MVAISLSSLLLLLTTTLPSIQAAAIPDLESRNPDNFLSRYIQRYLASKMPTIAGLPPNSNVTLQHVALGMGVQNYTCENSTAAPKAAGALAVLYDATWLFLWNNRAIEDISSQYLRAYEARSCSKSGATDVTDDCCEDEVNRSKWRLRTIGHHYFEARNGKGVPFFDLSRTGQKLSASAIANVKPAPDVSAKGANGMDAVNWLTLVDDGSGQSQGLKEVYRVATAGGSPVADVCKSGNKVVSVKYTAQYWFYE